MTVISITKTKDDGCVCVFFNDSLLIIHNENTAITHKQQLGKFDSYFLICFNFVRVLKQRQNHGGGVLIVRDNIAYREVVQYIYIYILP